jgi:HTH-type transcriptional regulator/antitoxin HigA
MLLKFKNQPLPFKFIFMKIIKNMTPTVSKKTTASIASENDYNAVMSKIDKLMAKGSENVSKQELAEIRSLALKAQAYEKKKFIIEPPTTFAGIIEMKMYDMQLRQTQLAKKLHISDTKLSLIMSGKQKPDISFLKAVHKELKIDANLLLEAV